MKEGRGRDLYLKTLIHHPDVVALMKKLENIDDKMVDDTVKKVRIR